jgi:hypothetical protein
MLDSALEPVAGVELPKKVFTSRASWMSLFIEWNTSANMFYFLKHLMCLILVIYKLKCNNLIFNEIMILNASYVCLHAFSLRRESPDPNPRRRTPHFWGGFVTTSSNQNSHLLNLVYSWCSRSRWTMIQWCSSCSSTLLEYIPNFHRWKQR